MNSRDSVCVSAFLLAFGSTTLLAGAEPLLSPSAETIDAIFTAESAYSRLRRAETLGKPLFGKSAAWQTVVYLRPPRGAFRPDSSVCVAPER